MKVQYRNGITVEAFLLSRSDNRIRAAVQGADDILEFVDIHGTWVSEDCEPVQIEFAWEGQRNQDIVTEADCTCSAELAERLIHLLYSEGQDPADAPRSAAQRGETVRGRVPAAFSACQSSLSACGVN